jgi:hypothetical protein
MVSGDLAGGLIRSRALGEPGAGLWRIFLRRFELKP